MYRNIGKIENNPEVRKAYWDSLKENMSERRHSVT